MRLNSEGLRELYQKETARSAGRREMECLPSELLARGATGELTPGDRERVVDHLATCADCTKEYRSLSPLEAWAEDASRDPNLATIGVSSGRARLAFAPRRQPRPQSFWERWSSSRPWAFYVPTAIAAALLILGLVLAAQLISQRRENQRLVAQINEPLTREFPTRSSATEELVETRRQLEGATRRAEQEETARRLAQEELAKREQRSSQRSRQDQVSTESGRTRDQSSQPHVNMPIFDLDPRASARGERNPAAATIVVPADADLFTLILNITGEQFRSNYHLEVLDHRGMTISTMRGLRKSPYNNFTVAFPRRFLPAGEYQLKLYGIRDSRKELVEDYAVRLVYR